VARPGGLRGRIILVVYLPILGLRGIEGKMFRPMALTVVFALAASLVCALTLMPVLASLLLEHAPEREPWLFRLARRLYAPLLERALGRPGRTAGAALALFLASLAIVPFLGAEFIPAPRRGGDRDADLAPAEHLAGEVEPRSACSPRRSFASSSGGGDGGVPHRPRRDRDRPDGVEISDTYLILKPGRSGASVPRRS